MNNENNGFKPINNDDFSPINPNELNSGLNKDLGAATDPVSPVMLNNMESQNTGFDNELSNNMVNQIVGNGTNNNIESQNFVTNNEVANVQNPSFESVSLNNIENQFIQEQKPEIPQNNFGYQNTDMGIVDNGVETAQINQSISSEPVNNFETPSYQSNAQVSIEQNDKNLNDGVINSNQFENPINNNIINSTTDVGSGITTSPSVETNFVEPNKSVKKDKKLSKKTKIIVIVVGVIAALAVAGLLVYRFYFNNPYNLMTSSLDKIASGYSELYDKLSIDYDLSGDVLSGNLDFSFEVIEDDTGTFSSLDGISVNITSEVDYKNEEIYTALDLSDNNENLSLQLQYLEDVLYINLGDLFNQTIYYNVADEIDSTEIFSEENFSSLESVDYSNFIAEIFDIYVECFDKSDAETETDKIDYFDDRLEITKTTYVFDKTAYNNLIDGLADSDAVVATLAMLFSYEESEIVDMLKNGELIAYEKGMLDFNVYTTGLLNSFVGFSITSEESIMYLKNKDEAQIIFKELYNGEDLVIELETKDDKTSYELELEEGMIFSGEISENKASISVVYDGLEMEVSYEITESGDSVSAGKIIATIAYDDGYETFDIKAIANIKMSKVSSVTNLSNGSITNLEDLTEADIEEIINNLNETMENSILSSMLYDEKTLFLNDVQTIAEAGILALNENETTCLNLSKLYSYGYVDWEIYYDYYATVSYDEETGLYYVSVMDSYNDFAVYNYNYLSGESINEDSVVSYYDNYSFNDFYYCS